MIPMKITPFPKTWSFSQGHVLWDLLPHIYNDVMDEASSPLVFDLGCSPSGTSFISIILTAIESSPKTWKHFLKPVFMRVFSPYLWGCVTRLWQSLKIWCCMRSIWQWPHLRNWNINNSVTNNTKISS